MTRRPIGTIDLTPTWRDVVLVYLDCIREQRPTQDIAWKEIERMADLADAYNALVKRIREDESLSYLLS